MDYLYDSVQNYTYIREQKGPFLFSNHITIKSLNYISFLGFKTYLDEVHMSAT
jgi:hypothetical protein